jgi:hypothetical protein
MTHGASARPQGWAGARRKLIATLVTVLLILGASAAFLRA